MNCVVVVVVGDEGGGGRVGVVAREWHESPRNPEEPLGTRNSWDVEDIERDEDSGTDWEAVAAAAADDGGGVAVAAVTAVVE